MQNLGRYEIIEQIGAGAMGAVYKARDPMMGRDVAIKTILSHALEGPQGAAFRERFFGEAQAAGRLAHSGIVTVYDVSEHEGTPFLVMEYVAGQTLQSVLQDGERMDTDQACDMGIQIAEALDYAHRNGVIHRDIKPANILIGGDHRVKIADFGVARLAESQITSTGQLLGTPAFMAPEQFASARIDRRADLFAAGVVIYWMATGDKPFTGDTILSVQYKVVHTDPVPPRKLNPAVSREFEAVMLKSLAKDPAERYQTGEELARALRAVRTGRTMSAHASTMRPDEDPTIPLSSSPVVPATSAANPHTAKTVLLSDANSGAQAHTNSSMVPTATTRRGGGRTLFAALVVVMFVLGSVVMLRTLKNREVAQNAAALSAESKSASPPAPDATKRTKAVANKTNNGGNGLANAVGAVKTEAINLELAAREQTSVIFRTEGQPTETLAMKAGDSVTLRAEKGSCSLCRQPLGLAGTAQRQIDFLWSRE